MHTVIASGVLVLPYTARWGFIPCTCRQKGRMQFWRGRLNQEESRADVLDIAGFCKMADVPVGLHNVRYGIDRTLDISSRHLYKTIIQIWKWSFSRDRPPKFLATSAATSRCEKAVVVW